MIIYKIINTSTKDFYIGKTTKTLKERFYQHKYNAYNKKSQTHIHRAIRKYGYENFTIEKIDEAENLIELNQKEILYIKNFSPTYNMTKGGDGGDVSYSENYWESLRKRSYKHSEESKQKISKSNLGKNKPPLSEEHKNIISKSNKGRKHSPRSEEWKIKQSLSQKGKKRKPFSEDHIRKLKESAKKRYIQK
jgi:group I intron endonuclease